MKRSTFIYIVPLLFSISISACKSESGIPELEYPLEVELSGILNKSIGNEDTQFNAYLNTRTNINGEIFDQFFGMNFNAETRYESEENEIIMDRLLLSLESLSGFPAPGTYKISDVRSDSTFLASIRYNEQRRNSSQSSVVSLAYIFESTTGSVKIHKTDNGTVRGSVEIVADLLTGTSSTYIGDDPPVREEFSFEASALTLIGEFQID